MKLSEEIRSIQQHIDAFQKILNSLQERLVYADKAWPDRQIIPLHPSEWNARDKIPPDGWVWASDGMNVWLIKSDGKEIPESASAVKFWTEAFIPHPPIM